MDEIRYFVWAAVAGMFIPVMAMLNGKLGRGLGDPFYAVMITLGLAFLVFSLCALVWSDAPLTLSSFQNTEPSYYLGGFIVGFYVISATLLAPRMGVANFIMMAVSSQMIFAVIIDHWGLFGAAIRPLSLLRCVGVVVLIAGVVIIQLAGQKPVEP
jgi:bacterial/archaeal transporter family-2 protein